MIDILTTLRLRAISVPARSIRAEMVIFSLSDDPITRYTALDSLVSVLLVVSRSMAKPFRDL